MSKIEFLVGDKVMAFGCDGKEVYATTAKEFITTALAEDEKLKEGVQ